MKFSFLAIPLLLFVQCRTVSHVEPESADVRMTANLVEIQDVVKENENLYLVSLKFSDRTGNIVDITAGSTVNYLEGGRYSHSDGKIGNRHFSAAASINGTAADILSGSLTVSRNNDKYTIAVVLQCDGYMITVNTRNKNIYFDRKNLDSMQKKEDTGFESDLVINSKVIGRDMLYSIYLPQSYDGVKEFPILYILHGMWGTNNDWFNHNKIHQYSAFNASDGGKEMIIVSLNAYDSFYCDGYMVGINMYTFFFEEFLPYIENTYKVKPGRSNRAIGGLSMGGYGSLYLGMSHPEMFCCIYACSAACGGAGDQTPALNTLFRSPEKLPEIVLEMGLQDSLLPTNDSFVRELESAGIQYEYITRNGMHDSKFWEECSPKILRKLNGLF